MESIKIENPIWIYIDDILHARFNSMGIDYDCNTLAKQLPYNYSGNIYISIDLEDKFICCFHGFEIATVYDIIRYAHEIGYLGSFVFR